MSRKPGAVAPEAAELSEKKNLLPDLVSNIETGFQFATFQGPLCAEPVEGLAYFVDSIEYDSAQLEGENGELNYHNPR
jgi:ribosome assembly protein 1